MEPWGTPQEIFPKSDSLFSVSTESIWSQREDLNHWLLCSENLITLRFGNKTSWFIVSNASWRSISIIRVTKLSSNSYNILPVKCAKHMFSNIWSKHIYMLWKSEHIKIAMLEKMHWNYSELFYIVKASPKQFYVFFFVQCFSFLELLQWQLLYQQFSHSLYFQLR